MTQNIVKFHEISHCIKDLFWKNWPFCSTFVQKEFREIWNMLVKNYNRRTAKIALRKKGNYFFKNERNELSWWEEKFLVLIDILPRIHLTYLMRIITFHVLIISVIRKRFIYGDIIKKHENGNGRKQHLTELQTFLGYYKSTRKICMTILLMQY